jgi:hypothetical protein
MNIAEILRKLADIADKAQDPAIPDDKIQNPAQLSPTAGGMPVDNVNNQDAGADDAVMVPPLQLKTELLKRAVGVDNIYDEGEPRADEAHENQTATDELAILKNRAGIPTAAVMELDNDELLDD